MSEAALTGMTALVTGGAKRLGRAIALGLAADGADVVVHYRTSAAEAEELCQEVAALGVRAWTVQADLGVADEVADLVARAVELAGPLRILVNNASIFEPNAPADQRADQDARHMTVNAHAPLELTRRFAAQKIASGHVVNLLDTRLRGGDPEHESYIASKRALEEITRETALEFAPRIAVNAVAPGLVLPEVGEDASALPLQRHGSPDDVADAVVNLTKTRFVTGQIIFVDGGRHLRY